MNALSWTLYLAGLVGNLSVTLGLLGCLGIFIGATVGIICGIIAPNVAWDRERRADAATLAAVAADKATCAKFGKQGFRALRWGIVFVVIAQFVPSAQTMYLIAASQMGETVVNSPESKEIIDLARDKIKEFLAPTSAPTKK